MGHRPNKTKALDGKSYKVFVPGSSRLLRLFLQLRVKGNGGRSYIGNGVYILKECVEDQGNVIVWEKSDKLACPICTEGKSCFQRAPVVYMSEIKKVIKDDKAKYFRLLVKVCSKEISRTYIFQHLCSLKEYESVVNTGFIRIISTEQFNQRCVYCPSDNLILKESYRDNIKQVVCRGCRLLFYVADCSIVMSGDLEDRCPKCKKKYSHQPDFDADYDLLRGTYNIKCNSCGERYIFLGSKHQVSSDILKEALNLADRKK